MDIICCPNCHVVYAGVDHPLCAVCQTPLFKDETIEGKLVRTPIMPVTGK